MFATAERVTTGGCLRPCKEPLSCGHICPYKCHSDDPDHRTILCNQNCLRLCPQGHPCNKLCSETCGNCQHPIFDVTLPCGHVSPSVPWYVLSVSCVSSLTAVLAICRSILVRFHAAYLSSSRIQHANTSLLLHVAKTSPW